MSALFEFEPFPHAPPIHRLIGQRMKQSDFVSQVNELASRGCAFFLGGGLAILLMGVEIFSYVFHRAPIRAPNSEALWWYLSGFVVTLAPVIAFGLVLSHLVTRRAPACAACGIAITWRERSAVLASGRCPKCNDVFLDDIV